VNVDIPIYLGQETMARLVAFCEAQRHNRFLLVADDNTYQALGRQVESALGQQGWDVRVACLKGRNLIADEGSVFDVLYRARGEQRTYLAVGSGTITDITRYASFCARNPFISLPTAPSVDAYASGGAALVMGGYKLTVPGHAPAAIFADLPTLCKAPGEMIAAGFGDMLGKYTSLADWKLGTLLLDEAFSVEIAERAECALLDCVAHSNEIGSVNPRGIRTLTEALFESGLCMMDFGNSRPASGSEHLLSHYWEISLLQKDRAPVLHGAKVGVGTVLAAGRFQAILNLSHQEATERLAAASVRSPKEEISRIQKAFGPVANRIIPNHQPYLELLEANHQQLRDRIGERWGEIQNIAAAVPPGPEIAVLLRQVGAPSDAGGLGLNEADVEQALEYAHYLRARFTVHTLGRLLHLW
jgi:glycerol-1-phosphate dehydrogenase [NAD(P)+]